MLVLHCSYIMHDATQLKTIGSKQKMSRHHSRRLVILKHVGDMKQAAHMTFYSCSGRETLYIPVSSIVGALQSTDTLMLNAQCSMLMPWRACNERGMCETKFVICRNYHRLRHVKW